MNRFIEREQKTDVPLPIVKAVKDNINRAVVQLPKEMKKEPYWTDTLRAIVGVLRVGFLRRELLQL